MFKNKNCGSKYAWLIIWTPILICIVSAIALVIGSYNLTYRNQRYPTAEPSIQYPSYETPPPEEIPSIHSPSESALELKSRTLLTVISELRGEYSNDEIIGLLEIEGTNISYPVVQASDNNYYLHRNLRGADDVHGSIFMDFENDPAEFDDNTIIYGHNMRDGSMFHNLRYYMKESFYKEHRYILLTTPYEETQWEVFAFCHTSTDFYYINTNFSDADSFSEHLSQLTRRSEYDTGVFIGIEDKILTLSTCSAENDNNRYVLCAKLLI